MFYWRAQKVLAQVDIWNVYSAAVIADNGKMCYRFDHDIDLPTSVNYRNSYTRYANCGTNAHRHVKASLMSPEKRSQT